MDTNRIIQGLWVGNRLSTMQQLSIKSFLAHGHEYHLYAYNSLIDVPAGTTMKDANEIIPPARIFKNAQHDTYAAFSDYFRYKMLLDRGGWWADLDLICVKPFDFESDYVFSSEHDFLQPKVDLNHLMAENTNAGVIKAPKGAPLLAEAWATCCAKDRAHLDWDEVGPMLVRSLVAKYQLKAFVKNATTFCPIPHFMMPLLFEPSTMIIPENVYAIHLWNELWRRHDIDPDGKYDPNCLYAKLKDKYLK